MAGPDGRRPREVRVSVDEVTVVLGLLGMVCEDHADDAEVLELAQRAIDRLRERVIALDAADAVDATDSGTG